MIRCEWSDHGLETLGRDATVVIVDRLAEILADSVSGCELMSRACADVALAAEVDRSKVVPIVDERGWLVGPIV